TRRRASLLLTTWRAIGTRRGGGRVSLDMTPKGVLGGLRGPRTAVSMAVVVGLVLSACASSPSPVKVTYALGHFPAAATGSFSTSGVSAFQAVLDEAVKEGLPGISATVMTADGRLWTGVAGTADGVHPV